MDNVTSALEKELEHQKLLLEIEELRRSWWKSPNYVAAVFPTFLAICTVVYGIANGYIQASFTKLENQKYQLQQEIRAFNEEKERIIIENRELGAEDERKRELLRKLSNPPLLNLELRQPGNSRLDWDREYRRKLDNEPVLPLGLLQVGKKQLLRNRRISQIPKTLGND